MTHLKDKTKSRTITVNLPTVEVHKQAPVSLASLYGSATLDTNFDYRLHDLAYGPY